MATGASTADLALVLVDATAGLREQSRRHICIAALLGVDQLVVCANKMDLVDWDRSAYQWIADDMGSLAHRLGISSCTIIPISALHGDNVVTRSDAAPWYDGPTVLDALESAQAGGWAAQHGISRGSGARLPVQWVLRQPGGGRSYAGMVNGGPFRVGDPVVVLPQGAHDLRSGPSRRPTARSSSAEVGLSVSLRLADHLDVSRGDLIAAAEDAPEVTDSFEATVCWFKDSPLARRRPPPDQAHHSGHARRGRGRDGHFRRQRAPHRRGERGARERNRHREVADGDAPGGRPLRSRSHHRQLRVDRRADVRHHRGGHGRPPAAP